MTRARRGPGRTARVLRFAVIFFGVAITNITAPKAGPTTTAAERDAQILAQINSRVLDARAGYFAGIKVDIVSRGVLLTGRVKEPRHRTRAAALIRSVPDVAFVINEIRLGKPMSLSRRADQSRLEGRIGTALHRAFRTTLPTVIWRVAENTTYIFGETSSLWAHARIFSTLERVKDVGRVVDQLRITQNSGKR